MADQITDPAVIAAQNAAAIQTQAAQDVSGQPTNTRTLEAVPALDALMDEKRKAAEAAAAAAAAAAPAAAPAPAPAPVVEADPAKAAPVADPAAAAPAAAPAAPLPVIPGAAPAAPTGPTDAELATKANDIFKDVPALPPQTSPKASESFNALKVKAARDIYEAETKLAAATRELEEIKAKLQNPVPPEIENELKELRDFRAKLDVDFDPKFKQFDATVNASREFIYAQLAKSPNIPAETIQQIKDMGGPDKVKMEKILDVVGDGTIRRLVETKLGEIEMENFRKEAAIADAKKNIGSYMESRQQEVAAQAESHLTETKTQLQTLVTQIPWLNPVKVDPKADAPTRAAAEQHNTYAKHMMGEIEGALQEDSPQMRATLLIGMANLFRLQSVHEQITQKYAEAQKEIASQAETIKKLQSASASRLNTSNAPATGTTPVAPAINPFTTRAGDALDALRQQKLDASRAA